MKDYHVHTYYSDDSIYPMQAVITDARERGIDELCFTEHVDYGIKQDWHPHISDKVWWNCDYPHYFEEVELCRRKYPDMTIRAGLEFGIQMCTLDQYKKLYHTYEDKLDFVLLSVHQIENEELASGAFMAGKTPVQSQRGYYEYLLQLVRSFKHYSVLAHMDLIARYDRRPVPFEDVKDLITEILKQVIEDGKGIEINTSTKRYGVENTCPSTDILKLYKELGGTILTFGSDSHKPEHLGTAIEDHMALAKELGFKQYCTFSHGKPEFHDL